MENYKILNYYHVKIYLKNKPSILHLLIGSLFNESILYEKNPVAIFELRAINCTISFVNSWMIENFNVILRIILRFINRKENIKTRLDTVDYRFCFELLIKVNFNFCQFQEHYHNDSSWSK